VAKTAHPSAKVGPRLPSFAGARERALLFGVQGTQPRRVASGRAAAVACFDLLWSGLRAENVFTAGACARENWPAAPTRAMATASPLAKPSAQAYRAASRA
jgi:hypothetical protein